MSKKNFSSTEEAQAYLEKLQAKVSEYNDLQYNLGQEMEKEKASIMALKNLQGQLRLANYELWQQQSQVDREVEELQDNEATINDLINGIM